MTDGLAGRALPGPRWLQVAALLLLAGLVYANAVGHPFLYDDLPLVLQNPKIRSLENIPGLTVSPVHGALLHPRWTRFVTHALEYAIAGSWAPFYHATNVALHALTGVLVFLLIGRASGSRALGWWSAALFLVHPINTEVVAHVAGRRGLLAALFSLTALLLLQSHTRRGGSWRLPSALVAIYLAAFSKEHALLTPVAFVLLDGWSRLRSQEPGAPLLGRLAQLLRQRRALYAGLTLCTLVLAQWFVGSAVTVHAGMYETSGGGLGWIDRAGIAGLALRMLILPIGQSVDYSFDALGVVLGSRPLFGADLAILALGLALGATALARRSWVAFAGLWMLLFFSPHIGFISWHEVFAERFLYLPSIGFCVGIAAAGLAVARRPGWQRPATALGAATIVLLCGMTIARNQVWASPKALWSDAVERYPSCARAQKALGDVYLKESRPDLALEHYSEATRLADGYVDAYVGLALAHSDRGDFGTALRTVDALLDRWPQIPRALNLKGFIHETFGDDDQAIAAYRAAVGYDRCFADGYNNLARFHAKRGEMELAAGLYERAVECDPSLIVAWRNLATIHRIAFTDERQAALYEREAVRLERVR